MALGPALDRPFLLGDLLAAGLRADPDGPAVIARDETLTWAELDRRSRSLARHYLALGLVPGERVATLLPNRTVLVVHHLACLRAGLVSAPLNYRYMPPEIDHALDVCEAALLVHHVERDADVAACDQVGRLRLGTLRFADQPDAVDGPDLSALLDDDPADVPLPPVRQDAPLFVFFTSGSTGPAKGVTHTVDTLGWMVANLVRFLDVDGDDVVMTTTSLSYLGGMSWALMAFAAGASLAMATSIEGSEVYPLVRSARPTMTWMLPSTLYALLADHGATHDDFAGFRYVATAGDRASGDLERRFAALAGYDLVELYGMTEAIGIAMTPPGGPNRLGSAGPPGAGVELEVRDDHGVELPPDEVGRLWVRYRGTTVGYWARPEATAEVLVDGWLDTGDLVRLDDDGYVWFAGRRKQIIVHDGSNIAPQEVEDALLEHPAVTRAGVVGIHDLHHGENVWAYVSLDPSVQPPAPGELIAFAAERVGYKAPEVVEVLDHVPVTAVGKTDRSVLKRLAAARHDTDLVH